MTNQFKVKNGLIVDAGGAQITGSLNVSGSIIATDGITGSIAGTASFAETASFALTASYLDNYIPPFPFTGSAEITGSLQIDGNLIVTGSNNNQLQIGNNLLFVSGSGNIGIGTNSPTSTLNIVGKNELNTDLSFIIQNSTNSRIFEVSNLDKIDIFRNNNTSPANAIVIHGPFGTNFGANQSNRGIITFLNYSGATNIYSGIQGASTNYGNVRSAVYFVGGNSIRFVAGSTVSPNDRNMYFSPNGNLSINSLTDAGFKLDVNGTARVQGNLSIVGISADVGGLFISNGFGYTTNGCFSVSAGLFANSTSDVNFALISDNVGAPNVGSRIANYLTIQNARNQGSAEISASGTINFLNITSPSFTRLGNSSNGTYNAINVNYTVNRTGTGVVRGFYYNPSIINLGGSIHNAIQTNAGNIFFNNATVRINQVTDEGFQLDVNGTARVQGNFTLTEGANIILQTATGSRIGTATNQRLAFWNATPIVQPINTTPINEVLTNTGLMASGSTSTTISNDLVVSGSLTVTGTIPNPFIAAYAGM
jgi:hypothetical protein